MTTIWQTPWLLIASPELDDANFRRTVVLIAEHSAGGSVGFIINRPLSTPLVNAFATGQPTAGIDIPADVPVWEGGPVAKDRGVILSDQSRGQHSSRSREGATSRESQSLQISLTSSTQALAVLAADAVARKAAIAAQQDPLAGSLYPHRFLIGYAGWGAGQLTDEVRRGSWLQIPATWDLVFNCSWRALWDEASAHQGDFAVPTPELNRSPYLN